MVTGWSYLAGSRGVPEVFISCTTALPREVMRKEMCTGPLSDMPCIGGSVLTGPSHSPARLLTVLKDACASDGAGVVTVDWECARGQRSNQRAQRVSKAAGAMSL